MEKRILINPSIMEEEARKLSYALDDYIEDVRARASSRSEMFQAAMSPALPIIRSLWREISDPAFVQGASCIVRSRYDEMFLDHKAEAKNFLQEHIDAFVVNYKDEHYTLPAAVYSSVEHFRITMHDFIEKDLGARVIPISRGRANIPSYRH